MLFLTFKNHCVQLYLRSFLLRPMLSKLYVLSSPSHHICSHHATCWLQQIIERKLTSFSSRSSTHNSDSISIIKTKLIIIILISKIGLISWLKETYLLRSCIPLAEPLGDMWPEPWLSSPGCLDFEGSIPSLPKSSNISSGVRTILCLALFPTLLGWP